MDEKNKIEKMMCKECNIEKPIDEFPVDKRAKTGHKKICKECYNKIYKNRNKKSLHKDIEVVIQEYFKEHYSKIYKALLIQSIAEEKSFMNVLIDSIHIKNEYAMIVNQIQNKLQQK